MLRIHLFQLLGQEYHYSNDIYIYINAIILGFYPGIVSSYNWILHQIGFLDTKLVSILKHILITGLAILLQLTELAA